MKAITKPSIRTIARKYYEAGFLPIPIRHDGSKRPAVDWKPFTDERYDAELLDELFDDGMSGLGLICGVPSGGLEVMEFEGRAVAAGLFDRFWTEEARTAFRDVFDGFVVESPSGGVHFYFRTSAPLGNTKLARDAAGDVLIETRGQGGMIVAAPSNGSCHPSGGSWRPLRGKPVAVPTIDVVLRDALFEYAREFDVQPVVERTQPVLLSLEGSDDSPAEWVRRNRRIGDMLQAGGWAYSHSQGDDTYWTRPGKDVRNGHSAVLHGDAPLVAFSSNVPVTFERAASKKSGSELSLSPFDVFAAVYHGGDHSEAAGAVRRLMPKAVPASAAAPVPHVPLSDEAETSAPVTVALPTLPDEFWTARPWLEAVREAAWSRVVAPDAVLGAVLARYATLVPTAYRIPPIVGSEGTFDWMSVLVGHSAAGKSSAMRIAAEIIPARYEKTIRWDLPVGSGEGLVQAFYGTAETDNGKTEQRVTQQAVHFAIDEGKVLADLGNRQGSTLISVMCSALMGQNLGQANATKERNRVIEARRVRVAAVAGIQVHHGDALVSEALISQGFTGRILFFATEDPTLPDDLADWPDTFPFEPPPPNVTGTTVPLTYSDSVIEHIRNAQIAKVRGQSVETPIEGHQRFIRARLAGLFALTDGRLDVTDDDWTLAGIVTDTSARIRSVLIDVARHKEDLKHESRARRTISTAVRIDEAKAERAHGRDIAGRVLDYIAEGAVTRKELLGRFNGSDRPVARIAIDQLITNGTIETYDAPGQGAPKKMVLRFTQSDD